MPLVFWFCFICLNLPEAHTVWLSPHPIFIQADGSWERSYLWYICFQNLLQLGFLTLQIHMLRIIFPLSFSYNLFFKICLFSFWNTEEGIIQHNCPSDFILTLHCIIFLSCNKECLKSFCNGLARSAFLKAVHVTVVLTFIIYTTFYGFQNMLKQRHIFRRWS